MITCFTHPFSWFASFTSCACRARQALDEKHTNLNLYDYIWGIFLIIGFGGNYLISTWSLTTVCYEGITEKSALKHMYPSLLQFILKIFNWRIVALQRCVGSCQCCETAISMHKAAPPWASPPLPPQSHPSRSWGHQAGSLWHTTASHSLSMGFSSEITFRVVGDRGAVIYTWIAWPE